jgi:glucose-6-phosphate isomerase
LAIVAAAYLGQEGADAILDYAKHRVTDGTLQLRLQHSGECGLRGRSDAMFWGEKINVTEQRVVLYATLLAPRDASIVVDDENVVPEVHGVL